MRGTFIRSLATGLVAICVVAAAVVGGPSAVVADTGPDAGAESVAVDGREPLASAGVEGSIYRLYLAVFERPPDPGGFDHWVRAYLGGTSLPAIATVFAASPEFTATYGDLGDTGFVRLVYRNVLLRDPDAGGLAHWTAKLAEGRSRGWVMVGFSESPEFVAATGTPAPVAPTPPAPRAVTSGALCIGDSVMLGASPAFHDTLGVCGVVDAAVSRQMTVGADVARGHLARVAPPAVVVHLGTNGTASGVDELLSVLRDVERVVLVDVATNGTRSWEVPVSAALAAAADRWPNTTLASWRSWSAGQPTWFAGDGIHLTAAGADGYARLIAAALS